MRTLWLYIDPQQHILARRVGQLIIRVRAPQANTACILAEAHALSAEPIPMYWYSGMLLL